MTSSTRPRGISFDVIETLFSLEPVGIALSAVGLDQFGLDRFFTRVLRDGFVLAATGTYRPFRDVADAALSSLAPSLTPAERDQVLQAFGRLDAHPDARPALEHASRAGVPVAALTNGSAAVTTALLDRAGLRALVTRVISIDEVHQWKPAPAVYRHAAEAMGVEPARLAHVAVHAWDLHGAHHAGLITGWASRLEGTLPATFTPPDVTEADLVGVVDRLLFGVVDADAD
jgi:2-haloacid dehalogenase